MREIERTSRFKRITGASKKLDHLLNETIDLLAADRPLPQRSYDHPLSGDWRAFATVTSGRIWSADCRLACRYSLRRPPACWDGRRNVSTTPKNAKRYAEDVGSAMRRGATSTVAGLSVRSLIGRDCVRQMTATPPPNAGWRDLLQQRCQGSGRK